MRTARFWTAPAERSGDGAFPRRQSHLKAASRFAYRRTPRRFAPDIRHFPYSSLAFSLPASVPGYKCLLQPLQPCPQFLNLRVLLLDGTLQLLELRRSEEHTSELQS